MEETVIEVAESCSELGEISGKGKLCPGHARQKLNKEKEEAHSEQLAPQERITQRLTSDHAQVSREHSRRLQDTETKCSTVGEIAIQINKTLRPSLKEPHTHPSGSVENIICVYKELCIVFFREPQ